MSPETIVAAALAIGSTSLPASVVPKSASPTVVPGAPTPPSAVETSDPSIVPTPPVQTPSEQQPTPRLDYWDQIQKVSSEIVGFEYRRPVPEGAVLTFVINVSDNWHASTSVPRTVLYGNKIVTTTYSRDIPNPLTTSLYHWSFNTGEKRPTCINFDIQVWLHQKPTNMERFFSMLTSAGAVVAKAADKPGASELLKDIKTDLDSPAPTLILTASDSWSDTKQLSGAGSVYDPKVKCGESEYMTLYCRNAVYNPARLYPLPATGM